YFNGENAYVEVSPSPITGIRSVSIEMLLNLHSDNYERDVLVLISGQSQYNIYLEKYSTEAFTWVFLGTDNASYRVTYGTFDWYGDLIYLVGVAEEGVSVRCYLNAELIDETSFPVGVRDAIDNLELMQDHEYARRAKGTLHFLRIYNRALSEREIRAHANYLLQKYIAHPPFI
ncbi:MAG: hypothetical protein DRP01_10720, partial [Archaeoglobales archaeon]